MSITDQLEEERRIINAATAGPLWTSSVDETTQVYLGEGSGSDVMIAEFYNPADAKLFMHAHKALRKVNRAMTAALKTHEEIIVYRMDLDRLEFIRDDDGEPIEMARICSECSSEDSVIAVENGDFHPGENAEVEHPCPTVRAIEEAGA